MEQRLERDAILQCLCAEHRRLSVVLEQLTAAQALRPNVVGYWSVKDVVSHLVFWNQFAVNEVSAAVQGRVFPHPPGTGDEINALAVAEYSAEDWDEVRSLFEQSCRQVINLVENLPNEAFEPDNRIEQVLEETVHGALSNNTYEHWSLHEAQIRAWIDTL